MPVRPSGVKPLLAATAALLVLAVSGCGSETDAVDTGLATEPSLSSSPSAPPAAPPSPTGTVRTAGLVTVIDEGEGPEVCLGPIAMSFPPQCSGPAVEGWDWSTSGQGMHETQGSIRWGSYALTGTWDGSALTVDDAVPAALYDAAPVPSEPGSEATVSVIQGADEVVAALQTAVPDAMGVTVLDGQVHLDVAYDDGSVQDWADATYGPGVVVVTSALLPA
ncbi:hypothetical protein [Nocardioides flavescens]|uniref:Uncharacterized protein n=1 Tax=Nocardioides flavescens TaxID=2691959 RepID=A0A6L7F481_9ACTN|nr:hypothetical protein [Nocardioides flavescens]MXG91986.1 hypothetical protein [Nocardioides flavescens]